MIRRVVAILVFVAAGITAAPAQRNQQSNNATSSTDLVLNVGFDDNNEPCGTPKICRVQLLTSARMPISDNYANERGQVTFRVAPGSYLVQVTSTEAESSEITFVVNPRESFHSEWVHLKRKDANNGVPQSTDGSISAASLNIPDKAKKEFDKGLSASEKQDYMTAKDHFNKAVEIYPQYALALVNVGVIAMKEGDSAQGQTYFERAIQADPQMPNGYTNLARIRILQANYPEAEKLLTKAISIRPLDPEPLTMMATAEVRAGELDQAIANIKKVHSVPHEHFAVVHLLAADAYVKQHHPDLAVEEYKIYLKEMPLSPHAESVRAALESLQRQTKDTKDSSAHYR